MSLVPLGLMAQRDAITDKTHTLEGVEVQAHAVPADVRSGTPVQSMPGERLEQLGLVMLSDAVKQFVGVQVRDYGGIGGMKTVSVRNLGAHHTAVSYDGVVMGNTESGQIDIGRFTLDNVARLSMAVGQAGDLMQSARHLASGGVLAIETERPHFEGRPWSLRARLRGGSFGLVSPSLRYWQRVGERTSLSVDGTFTRADGQYPFTLKNGRETVKGKRYNSDISSAQGEANLYHTFSTNSELQAKFYYYYSERGLPGVVILYNGEANERLWDEHVFGQAQWKQRLGTRWSLRTSLKYTHSWNKYVDVNVRYPGGERRDVDRQNEWYASATLGWKPLRHFSMALAADGIIGNLRNNLDNQPNPTRYTSLTALTARWQDDRLTAEANLVATYIHEHTATGSVPADRKRLAPALSASWRLLSEEPLYVRAMVKSTFRAPTFTDMYYLHIGNVNLRPEKALEYNAGLTWTHYIYNKVNVTLTADAYYNTVHDKIVAFPTTYVWRMTNFGRVHITGLDATLSVDAPIARGFSANLAAAYTLQRAIDKTDPTRESYGDQIPYTPRHSGNGTLTVVTPWVTVGYAVTACGQRWSMGQNTEEYRLHPYWEHTLTASHEFRIGTSRLTLSASVLNLTNEQYQVIQYYPMPGRSWQAAATWTF